jgi:hypothetical protein
MVDVPVLVSGPFLLGFPITRGVVDADVEECAPPKGRERKLLGGGFGKGLHRALGLRVKTFLLDGLE